MKKYRFLCLLLVLLFSACKLEEPMPEPDYSALSIYLDRFEQEAQNLGYDLDLSGVEAVYVGDITLDNTRVCGYGYSSYPGTGRRRIEISRAGTCNWLGLTDIQRENLFFHEIGHAFLNRLHDDTRRCDGSPLSMMAPGAGLSYYREDEPAERTYYISELIDRVAAADQCIEYGQDWGTDSLFYDRNTSAAAWTFFSDQGRYSSDQVGDSLVIEAFGSNNAVEAGYWWLAFDHPNIPQCAEVKLKATLNAADVKGAGVGITLRAFRNALEQSGARGEQYLVETTEDEPLQEPLQDHQLELTIPCFSRETTRLVLLLVMLPGTEGEVSFSDVQLIVNEK